MTDMTEQTYQAVTDFWRKPPSETPCTCSNCEWSGMGDDLDEIEDCSLTPGDPSPAGRCPDCCSLAYVDTPETRARDAAPDLLVALEALHEQAAAVLDYRDDPELQVAVDAAVAAIAKAKGQ